MLTLYVTPCRRAFFDKRLAQEVEGDALGDVRAPPAVELLFSVLCPVRTYHPNVTYMH